MRGLAHPLVLYSAGVASAVRLYYAVRIPVTQEVTYATGVLSLWTMGEIAITQMCGCMPVLPRFFQHVGPKVFSPYKGNSSTRTIPKASTYVRFPVNRGVPGDSGSSLHNPLAPRDQFVGRIDSNYGHELSQMKQHERPWSNLNRVSLSPETGLAVTDGEGVEERRKELPILRTVHIETHHEEGEADLERQYSEAW